MKIKSDSNALLTAAAFGTASVMMLAFNHSNSANQPANVDASAAKPQRFARAIDEDYADGGNCNIFLMDGEDCPEKSDASEYNDVFQFQDSGDSDAISLMEGKKGGRREEVTIGNYWIHENRESSYNKFMQGFTDQVSKGVSRRTPKQAPTVIDDESAILPAGSPWFDGDLAYLNDKVNPDSLDMTEYTLRSFNIYYPQTAPYDVSLGLEKAQNLWQAYKSFIAELYYLISHAVGEGIGNDITLTGYAGVQHKATFKRNAKQVQNFGRDIAEADGKRNRIKTALDASAYGQLANQGFVVPTRRGKKGTISFVQPKFRNLVEFWKKDYQRKNYADMYLSQQTCVNVYIMHDIFQDAAILDNWFLSGTQSLQSENRDNLRKCLVIPVMIHGDIEGVEDWMNSAIGAFVPNIKKYAQIHPDKKQFHNLHYDEFIANWRQVARSVASWTAIYANRGQCIDTTNPFDLIADTTVEPTAGPTTTTTVGTTTTDWTTAPSDPTEEPQLFREVTTVGASTASTEGFEDTEAPEYDTYCCFGTINSKLGTIETCPLEFDETSSFF